jgi:hypothetical protein
MAASPDCGSIRNCIRASASCGHPAFIKPMAVNGVVFAFDDPLGFQRRQRLPTKNRQSQRIDDRFLQFSLSNQLERRRRLISPVKG